MGMARRTITLMTDFGLKDPYVGTMKGVILSINPDVNIVDITHETDPQDIREGSFLVKEYYPYFRPGTIHVAVIDPTVGSERRPIIISRDGHLFVGPDNGLFSYLFSTKGEAEVYWITQKEFLAQNISPTFHGRDIFAPVAGHLSLDIPLTRFGMVIDDPVCLTDIFPTIVNRLLRGEVVRFDRFGNAITNIGFEVFQDFTKANSYTITIGDMQFHSLNRSYYEDDLTCLIGSSGYLEFACYKGNLKERRRIKKGEPVIVRLV
jgi:hypothetical protein